MRVTESGYINIFEALGYEIYDKDSYLECGDHNLTFYYENFEYKVSVLGFIPKEVWERIQFYPNFRRVPNNAVKGLNEYEKLNYEVKLEILSFDSLLVFLAALDCYYRGKAGDETISVRDNVNRMKGLLLKSRSYDFKHNLREIIKNKAMPAKEYNFKNNEIEEWLSKFDEAANPFITDVDLGLTLLDNVYILFSVDSNMNSNLSFDIRDLNSLSGIRCNGRLESDSSGCGYKIIEDNNGEIFEFIHFYQPDSKLGFREKFEVELKEWQGSYYSRKKRLSYDVIRGLVSVYDNDEKNFYEIYSWKNKEDLYGKIIDYIKLGIDRANKILRNISLEQADKSHDKILSKCELRKDSIGRYTLGNPELDGYYNLNGKEKISVNEEASMNFALVIWYAGLLNLFVSDFTTVNDGYLVTFNNEDGLAKYTFFVGKDNVLDIISNFRYLIERQYFKLSEDLSLLGVLKKMYNIYVNSPVDLSSFLREDSRIEIMMNRLKTCSDDYCGLICKLLDDIRCYCLENNKKTDCDSFIAEFLTRYRNSKILKNKK